MKNPRDLANEIDSTMKASRAAAARAVPGASLPDATGRILLSGWRMSLRLSATSLTR
ncbi:MAG: hypothetical protein BWX47_02147 [candidate division Hyd24-12 bacterium ADurb.Bin004]|nr:MAG: hypothetical protein BWX47_02147 [candidate division Hyd24-12 bacterium ADurb.Bin004]